MADTIKEYPSEELVVIWEPGKCIHSEKCWRGLPKVFNPKERPWINVKGAEDKTLRNQIDACPSGALSYRMNDGEGEDNHGDQRLVEVAKNGPLMVHGTIKVKQGDQETTREKVTAFCRCGASGNKPYCDGSHKEINFSG